MRSTSKLIAWFAFILGCILFFGGIVLALANVQSNSNIDLLGQHINTSSVGLAMVGLALL